MPSRQSLRHKINLAIALIFFTGALFFGGILFIHELDRRSTAIEEVESVLDSLSARYSEQLGNEIFAGQVLAVRATLAEVMQKDSFLAITAYTDTGELLVSSDESDLQNLTGPEMTRLYSQPIASKHKWHRHNVLTFTRKISAYGETVGFWKIQYSLHTLDRQTREIVLIFTGLILSLTALLCFILDRLLVQMVLKPVHRLDAAIQQIELKGRGSTPESGELGNMIDAFDRLAQDLNVPKTDTGEINSLARSFRQMLLSLKSAYIRMRTDALTGLSNRMRLDEALKEELDRALRYHHGFSIIMMDIDHFKQVNDTWGHLAGDWVLKEMASLITTALRSSDLAGRWGGEEFVVLLPFQDIQKALQVAEKLRKIIAQADFPEAGRLTASFGVAEYNLEKTVPDVVKKADQALYMAKKNGRNRVEAFGRGQCSPKAMQ